MGPLDISGCALQERYFYNYNLSPILTMFASHLSRLRAKALHFFITHFFAESSQKLRNFIDGVDIYGQTLKLSQTPFDASLLHGGLIAPPAVCVKGRDNKIEIIAPPAEVTEETLRERTKRRSQHIHRYGFLEQRSINRVPLVNRRI